MAEENTSKPAFDPSKLSDTDLDLYLAGDYGKMTSRGYDIVTGRAPESIISKITKMGDSVAGAVTDVGRDVYDWTRGAKVQYSGLPKLGDTDLALNLDKDKAAQLEALVLTTVDDDRLETGIKNIFPNAMTMRDSFGNVIASIPTTSDDGTKLGYQTFYPNPRGLDFPTITQLSGAVAAGTVLEPALSALGVPGKFGADIVATGLTESAIAEGISSGAAETDYNLLPVAEGTGWSGVFYAGGRVLGKLGGKIASLFKTEPKRLMNNDGVLTQEARNYLEKQGLNPDDIQIEIYNDLREMLEKNVDPQMAKAKAQAEGLPEPVGLTTGQLTGDLEEQLFEDAVAKGQFGESAKADMLKRYEDQQAAIVANIEEGQKVIARGGKTVARGEGAERVQQALVEAKEAARLEAKARYEKAREAGAAYLDPTTASTFGEEIAEVIQKDFNWRAAPITYGIMDDLDNAFKQGSSLEDLQAIRSQLSSQARNGISSDAEAAGRVLGMLDQKMQDMAEHNLFYGNNEAVGLWANAIKGWGEYSRTWNTNGILKKLTKSGLRDGEVVLDVAPEGAAKAILGGNFSGLIQNGEAVRTLTTLKNNLPKAEWDLLRQEAFILMADGLVSASTGKVANTFSREWFNANRKNPRLLGVLFEPNERAMINALAETSAKIARSAKNYSNTAASQGIQGNQVGSLIGRLLRGFGTTNVGDTANAILNTTGIRSIYGGQRLRGSLRGDLPTTRNAVENLILGGGAGFGMTPEKPEPEIEEETTVTVPPPQASIQVPTRGVPGLGGQSAPAPGATAQGPTGPSSREMYKSLFPFDIA